MSENVEHIEVTTQIGCPVQCARFCPQEVTAAKYFSDSGNAPYAKLSLENFRIMLATVPKSVQIVFSGFCEPFANPECIDLIEYAHNEGYTMRLYTTLYGATTSDVQRLIKIPFTTFNLHLCDGENTKIPLTDTYKENKTWVLLETQRASDGAAAKRQLTIMLHGFRVELHNRQPTHGIIRRRAHSLLEKQE
jgi:organic radical activating enzyme